MKTFALNRTQLKYVAVLAMLVDHIAWAFVSQYTPAGQIMHFIGRMTGPVMAYFIAEGYIHTKSFKKYILRVFAFSLIAWVPYDLLFLNHWPLPAFSVFSTFTLALVAIVVWDKMKAPKAVKALIVTIICALSIYCDWYVYGVVFPFLVFVFKDDPVKKFRSVTVFTILYIIVCFLTEVTIKAGLYNLGMIIPVLLLKYAYNGERGAGGAFNKWFFYVFYPLHMTVLYLAKRFF